MKKLSTLSWAVALLLIEAHLIFLPLIILGTSINWPASLDEPASVNLPLILDNYTALITGYGIYLLYSLLFWPVAYLCGRILVLGKMENVCFQIATGFALLSALARAMGIVRWLFSMPALAKQYLDSNSEEVQANISIQYEMLNSYAGGVGELIGVDLFAAIWLSLISVLILRQEFWPNWMASFGFITSALLCSNWMEVVGVNMGAMKTISVVFLHFWMLAAAFVFHKRREKISFET
ncbi:MAG: DUF4386 family protein [Bacteroidota bacterium]